MSPQIFHDTLRFFATGLSIMVGAVALVICGSLLFTESHSGVRPQRCARRPK